MHYSLATQVCPTSCKRRLQNNMNTRRQGVLRVILEAGYHRTKLRKNAECLAAAWVYGEQSSSPPTPFGWPETTGQRADFVSQVINSNSRPSAVHIAQGNVWKHGSILGYLTSSIWDPGCWFLLASTFLLLILPLINERGEGAQSLRKEWPHDLRKTIREQNTSVISEIPYDG